MLIILEGVDGAGKSTTADAIARLLPGATRLHKGPMTADAITEYEDPLASYRPGSETHVICDRWHVGELVYGPVLRGKARMTLAERRHIDLFLAARGAVVVHVTASMSTIRQRLSTRGDDLVTLDQIDELNDRYFDVVQHLDVVHGRLYTEADENIYAQLQVLAGTALAHEMRTAPLVEFPTYIGAANPTLLLLGERRNTFDRPSAFVPAPNTSGAYLLEHLPEDVFATWLGIANACEEDIGKLWETLGRPAVVALGRAAAEQCRQAELPHGVVPHPQYVRRFHHHHGRRYGAMIREAAQYQEDLSGALRHPSA